MSDLDDLRLEDFLCHIIEAIERRQRYVAGMDEADSDRTCFSAYS
jgi:hypothetical protein